MRLRTRSLVPAGLLWLAAAPMVHAEEVFVGVGTSGSAFDPARVVIHTGDTVTWINASGNYHNVVSDNLLFTSGPPAMYFWTYSHTFNSGGHFRYYCELHGGRNGVGMSGEIVVFATTLSIADRAVVEGNTGTSLAAFTVTLPEAWPNPVTVMFETVDGTAHAPLDYAAVSAQLLTFPAGTTEQTATVSVNGDTTSEYNETFSVHLLSPTNAVLADADAVGTILDDDAATDFFSLPPCRVLDTRAMGSGPALPANGTRVVPVAGLCGIPADAAAVALNVTAVNAGASGNFLLYPADAAQPLASTINFVAGLTRANNAVGRLGTAGQMAVRNNSVGTTDVLIDVTGYFRWAGAP
jgi:plastocyanin